jgi:protein TonB
MEDEMNTTEKAPDLNEIIFEGRNKEYGAYVLRRLYNKYISISTTSGALLFALIVSYPLITASLFPTEIVETDDKHSTTVILDNIQLPIDKEPVTIPSSTLPKTPVVKFVVPEVLPDALVTTESIPTIEDLIGKNPGLENIEGNIGGVDIIDITVVENIVPEVPVKEEIFTWAEEMPKFPGGDSQRLNYFMQNLTYPEIAKRAGVEGKVILSFVVDKNGDVSDIKVLKSIGAGCDEEAVRVINSMPLWSPGKQNGKPVLTRVIIPVVFKLR